MRRRHSAKTVTPNDANVSVNAPFRLEHLNHELLCILEQNVGLDGRKEPGQTRLLDSHHTRTTFFCTQWRRMRQGVEEGESGGLHVPSRITLLGGGTLLLCKNRLIFFSMKRSLVNSLSPIVDAPLLWLGI